MFKPNPHILVLAPYTKRVGVAVFRDDELVYFAVKTFRRPRTLESIRAETSVNVTRLIEHYDPHVILLKSFTRLQDGSKSQKQVAFAVRRIAKARAVSLKELRFEDAKKRLSTGSEKTRSETFSIVQQLHPEVTGFSQFQNVYQQEYYTSVLAAVAIGLAYKSISQ